MGILLEFFDPIVEGLVVFFEREEVVCFLIDDFRYDGLLRADGIDGDNTAFKMEELEQLWDGGDFLAFSSVAIWPRTRRLLVAQALTVCTIS